MKDLYAKEEFLEHTAGKEIKCALLRLGGEFQREEEHKVYALPLGFTAEDFNKFLAEINFDYDGGFGWQELFGHIWYADGTWSERKEYDGSEWWDYKSCPPIPTNLAQRATES